MLSSSLLRAASSSRAIDFLSISLFCEASERARFMAREGEGGGRGPDREPKERPREHQAMKMSLKNYF